MFECLDSWEQSFAMIVPMLPPVQAVFATVFKLTPRPHATNVASAPTRLETQLDALNRTPHPSPYRKPLISPALHSAMLLAIENVHVSQADADAISLAWAWQIAHQAELSEQEWDIEVFESRQVTPHRQT